MARRLRAARHAVEQWGWSQVATVLVWMRASSVVGPAVPGVAQAAGAATTRAPALTALLVGLAVFGPALAYAGVTVLYPASSVVLDVSEDPPVTFAAGADHGTAQNAGLAGPLVMSNNGGSWSVSLYGLSGGSVVYDHLANITVDPAVGSYRLEIATALSGITPTEMKLRAYTGTTAPTSDTASQVCAFLDLTQAEGTRSTGSCTGDARIQIVYTLPSGQTSQSGTVAVRPAVVTFA